MIFLRLSFLLYILFLLLFLLFCSSVSNKFNLVRTIARFRMNDDNVRISEFFETTLAP